jgi:o-succinylbenzoate synthase
MIERAWIRSYEVPLSKPWPSAEGDVDRRIGSVLFLEDDGLVGRGETAPWPGFGLETHASSLAALRLAVRRLVGIPAEAYPDCIAGLDRMAQLASAPCARHAVDLALHDLAAQRAGLPVARFLGGPAALPSVPVNGTIPRGTPDAMARNARELAASGIGTIKLKLGGVPLPEEVERVRAVREALGASVRIRVDANQAWSEREAIGALRALQPYAIEYCEQPVAATALEAMARVRAESPIPIAADESVRDLASARAILDAGAADLLVLKPMALGGLRAARLAAELARERGAGIVVTSLLESETGRAGALHVAASLGQAAHAHGLLAGVSPFPSTLRLTPHADGTLEVPGVPGLGIGSGLEAPARAAELVASAEEDE